MYLRKSQITILIFWVLLFSEVQIIEIPRKMDFSFIFSYILKRICSPLTISHNVVMSLSGIKKCMHSTEPPVFGDGFRTTRVSRG